MTLSPYLSVWPGPFSEDLFPFQRLWGCLQVMQPDSQAPPLPGMCLHLTSFL